MQLFAGEIDAMLIPDSVIVSDQTMKIVLTIGPENKVVPKPVSLGPIVMACAWCAAAFRRRTR